MAKERYTPEQMIAAIRETHGLLMATARRLGCTYQTVWNYTRRYEAVAAVVAEERAALLDLAEAGLYAEIANGERWAITFFLTTQGKARGYVTRSACSTS